MYYNNKIGNIRNYYNNTFISLLKNNNLLYEKNKFLNKSSCLVIYPILYKKMTFFNLRCTIIKKTKSFFNLNQTIILEGFLSRNKCFITIPILSFLNKVTI